MNVFAHATKYTRDMLGMNGKRAQKSPSRNLTNNKPFRTERQKGEARRAAVFMKEGRQRGTYVSPAPVSYHGPYREKEA